MEISGDDSDFSQTGFYEVKEYGASGFPAFVCYECEGHHRDIESEWSMIDDDMEWDNGDLFDD